MAGIGFRLQGLLNSKSYRSLAAAYGYSAIISSGPWMMSMISLVAIGLFITGDNALVAAGMRDAAAFRIVVTYVYAGSLLLGGLLHLGVARYISDRLYSGKMEEILPCFMRVSAAALGIGLILSGSWFAFSGLEAAPAVAGIIMFQSLTLIWLCMVFLSAAKGYEAIVWGFFICHVLGAGLAIAGYRLLAVTGAMWGYALGQAALGMWLSFRIVREFPSYSPETNGALVFLNRNRYLAGIGFAFNLGVWMDKFLVWHSPYGTTVLGWFRCSVGYDTCLFFAYLTVIPAMALFLIRIETSFYRNYSVYFNAVTCGGDLDAILDGKEKIKDSLWLSAARLVKSQGGISLCLVLAAPILAPYLGIGAVNIPVMRFALIAAFLQSLLLFMLIFFLYFDWQRYAFILSLLFVMLNSLFTGVGIMAGSQYLGLGYLFACLLSLLFGVHLLGLGLERLEFETFAKQVETR